MSTKLKLGRYKHYKGNIYEVIGIATQTETNEELVLYISIKPGEEEKIWARPEKNFLEKVTVDGKNINRFESLD